MKRLVLWMALVAGCGSAAPTGFGVNLRIEPGSVTPDELAQATTTTVTITGDQPDPYTTSLDILPQLRRGEARLRYHPRVRAGELTFVVQLRDDAGRELASGRNDAPVRLVDDAAVEAVITLGPPAPPDLTAEPTDMAMPDLSQEPPDPGKKGQGLPCSADAECSSQHCVDHTCCDSACSGQCEACNLGGVKQGICSPVSGAPVSPRSPCASDGSSCGGSCNGTLTTACVYPSSQCRPASCTDGLAVAAASCNGVGACPALSTSTCAPYVCGAVACKTSCASDADCAAGTYCSTSGACVGKLDNSAVCSRDSECQSNACARDNDTDPTGVCCNSECEGPCQSCKLAGHLGTCSLVPTGEDPRGACPKGADPVQTICKPGGCDGTANKCKLAPTGTLCRDGGCLVNLAVTAQYCTSDGVCPSYSGGDCGAYRCHVVGDSGVCYPDCGCCTGPCFALHFGGVKPEQCKTGYTCNPTCVNHDHFECVPAEDP